MRIIPLFVVCLFGFVGASSACSDMTSGDGGDGGGGGPTVVACEEEADCSAKLPICDPLRGCVECQFNDDCEEGKRCEDRACVPFVACTSDFDCRSSDEPLCDTRRDWCVECVLNSDCGTDAECVKGHCEDAISCVNSLDCPDDMVCDSYRALCVECERSADCGEDEVCVDRRCEPICASDKECTPRGLLCKTGDRYCAQCSSDADCPDVYFCSGGECLADVCRQGHAKCSSADLSRISVCSESGNFYEEEPCPVTSHCREDADGARCEKDTCTPHQTTCVDATTLSVCGSDGQVAEEIDCAETGQVCVSGACATLICEPGEIRCVGGNPMSCNSTGTALVRLETCTTDTFCSVKTGACEEDVCVASSRECDGDAVVVCKADGSGYEEEDDCAAGGGGCLDGECHPILCDEGQTFCSDESVYSCDEGGVSATLVATCGHNHTCIEGEDGASCKEIFCLAGLKVCRDNFAGICDETETGLVGGGTDCSATGRACFQGECAEIVCEGETACDEADDVRFCVADGTQLGTVREDCTEGEYCGYSASLGRHSCLEDD